MRAILVLLLVPMVSAAPVDLFLHVNGFQDMPMTTAAPDEGYAETVTLGLATHSTCIDVPGQSFTGKSYHVWEAFSSPGSITYHDDGKPRIMVGRGIAMDLEMEGDLVLHWFMKERQPLVLPDVRLDAVLFQDEGPTITPQDVEKSIVYARGSSTPTTLAGDLTDGDATYEDGIYHWTVPMQLEEPTATDGLRLRVTLSMEEPICQEGMTMLDTLAVHTDADHRPRLAMGVANPVIIEAFQAEFIGDDLVVHVHANSPFGRADLRPVEASGLPGIKMVAGQAPTCNSHNCHDLFDPSSNAVVWNMAEATPGSHQLQILVSNLQGTANETLLLDIEVGDGVAACMQGDQGRSCIKQVHDQSVPAPGILLLVGLLAARRFM